MQVLHRQAYWEGVVQHTDVNTVEVEFLHRPPNMKGRWLVEVECKGWT